MSASAQDSMVQHLRGHLSAPRFDTYRRIAASDDEAMRLYRWNLDMTGAVFQMLGVVEIALRNAIDRELSKWNMAQSGTQEWLRLPAPQLKLLLVTRGRDGKVRSQYQTAYGRAKSDGDLRKPGHPRKGAAVTHDDVLAHVTFGLWTNLLPETSLRGVDLGTVKPDRRRREAARRRIWSDATTHAFAGQNSEYTVQRWLERLHGLRNRVAHHEPLVLTDVRSYHLTATRILRAVDPRVGDWYAGVSPVPTVLKQCPIDRSSAILT